MARGASNRAACALRKSKRLSAQQTGISHLLADSFHQLCGEGPHILRIGRLTFPRPDQLILFNGVDQRFDGDPPGRLL